MTTTLNLTPIGPGGPPMVTGGPTQPGANLSLTPIPGAPQLPPQTPTTTGGATGDEGPLAATGNVLKNFIPSLFNFGVNVIKTPVQGLEDLAQIPGAISDLWKGTQVTQPNGTTSMQGGGLPALASAAGAVPATAYTSLVPKAVQALLPGVNDTLGVNGGSASDLENIPGTFLPRAKTAPDYGAASAAIQNDPVGQIAPLVLAGSAAAHGVSPEAGVAFDAGVSKMAAPVTTAADTALPILGKAAGATSGFVGGLVRYGVKGLTGLDASTIRQIIANPDQFTPEEIANTTRVSVAQLVKEALDDRDEALSESGKGYQPIRQSQTPIQVKPTDLTDLIQQTTGLKPVMAEPEADAEPTIQLEPKEAVPTGFVRSTEGSVLTPGDVSKVNAFYKLWQPKFQAGGMLPQEFLNMRQELADLSKYEGIGKSSTLENATSRMRGSVNTKYRSQIPGLEELDADQTAHRVEIKKLSNGLLDRDGNLRDSDINKIANGTGKSRTVLLGQLEELVPGITERLNALKAAEDIRDNEERHKVGTYSRAITGSGLTLGGIVTGNLPLIVGGITEAILSSPAVAIPLLRTYGFAKGITMAVMANLASIARSANELPNGGAAAYGKLTPSMQRAATKTRGLMPTPR